MAKFRSIKNSFLGGQISRTALGRTDDPRYAHSCELLQNMIPMLSGGASRRPGTLYQDQLPVLTNFPPRLVPFISSSAVPEVVLFSGTVGGNCAATVYNRYAAPVTVTGTPPYSVKTTFNVGTLGEDNEVFQLQYAQSVDVLYLVHPRYIPQQLRKVSAFSYVVNNFDADVSANPLTKSQIANSRPYLNQNSTATTLTVGTGFGTPGTTGVTLTASTATFVTTQVGAIFKVYDGATTLGSILITGFTSSTVLTGTILEAFGDSSAHVTWWESAWSDYRGWPRSVCIFEQRLVMAGTIHQPDTLWFSQTANYQVFSALGTTAAAGFPGGAGDVLVNGVKVTVTAGIIKFPVDDSQGDGQTTGPTGSQPFRITLSQNTIDQIQWLSPDKQLLIGTLTQEWLTSPENGDFSVQNSPVVLQSKYGSDYLPAIRIGYELIFPLAAQDEVRAYQYNYIDASFFAEPVQLFFDEYPKAEPNSFAAGRKKIRQMDWDVSRQTMWFLDTAGNFYGMTRDRKLNVTMWHTHQFGGYNASQGTTIPADLSIYKDPSLSLCDGSVVSFAIVPNQKTNVNDIWLVIKRTVNGTQQWQLEVLTGKNMVRESAYSPIFPGGSNTEPLMADSVFSSFDNNSPSNLSYTVGAHLEGYSLVGTIYSPTNGIFKVTTGVVTGGVAVLNHPLPADYGTGLNAVILGLSFKPIIKPVRIDVGSVIGTSQNAVKKINRIFVRLFKSMSLKAGSPPESDDQEALENIEFRTGQEPLAKSCEIFTGDKLVLPPTTYERDGYVYLEQDDPLPLTVLSITYEGQTFD